MPSANSRRASARLWPRLRWRSRSRLWGSVYSGPVDDAQVLRSTALDAGLREARARVATIVSAGLTTIPSPPAAVELVPPGDRGGDAGGVVEVDDPTFGRRGERVGSAAHRRSIISQVPGVRRRCAWTAPSAASTWNGASAQVVDASHRPAVAAVGVDEAVGQVGPGRGCGRRGRRAPAACRAACASRSCRCRQHRGRSGADRCVLAGEQLVGLGRPRQQLASSTSQSVSSSSHSPAAVDRGAQLVEQRELDGGVGEEAPAGSGAGPRRRSSRRARRSGGPATSASRHTTTTAREPMCFSSHTTRVTPSRRKASKASSGCSSSAVTRRGGAGRHRGRQVDEPAGVDRRIGSSPRARRRSSPRGS